MSNALVTALFGISLLGPILLIAAGVVYDLLASAKKKT